MDRSVTRDVWIEYEMHAPPVPAGPRHAMPLMLDYQALYQAATSELSDYGFLILDRSGIVEAISPAVNLIVGHSNELVGRPFHVLFPEEDLAAGVPERELDEAVRSGKSIDSRWLLRADGSPIFVDGWVISIVDPGRPVHFLKVMRDFTPRDPLGSVLHAVAEMGNECIYAKTKEGRYAFANSYAAYILGLQRHQLIGKRDAELLPAVFAEQLEAFDRRVYEADSLIEGEETVPGPDGEVRTFSSAKQPWRNRVGKTMGLVAISRDITPSQRMQREVANLRDSLDLTHTVIRLENGTVLWWSRGATRLYGWERGEALGRKLHELLKTRFPSSEQEITTALLRTGQWEGNVQQTTRDGQTITVAVHMVVQENLGQRVIVEAGNDVTELRKTQAAAEQALENLRASHEDLRQFSYVVSHDLQSPLSSVGILAQLLQRRIGGRLNEDESSLLAEISQGIEQMQEFIGQLLNYSQATTQRQSAEEPVDLNVIARQAVTALKPILDSADGQIAIDPLPVVWADALELSQLFSNLIGNAIKYARRGVPPHIVVSQFDGTGAGEIGISITDNGIGIPHEDLEQVFQPFKRIGDSAQPGAGIGLALCKKIVERNRGRIWVESTPGMGSQFFFTLRGQPSPVAAA